VRRERERFETDWAQIRTNVVLPALEEVAVVLRKGGCRRHFTVAYPVLDTRDSARCVCDNILCDVGHSHVVGSALRRRTATAARWRSDLYGRSFGRAGATRTPDPCGRADHGGGVGARRRLPSGAPRLAPSLVHPSPIPARP